MQEKKTRDQVSLSKMLRVLRILTCNACMYTYKYTSPSLSSLYVLNDIEGHKAQAVIYSTFKNMSNRSLTLLVLQLY